MASCKECIHSECCFMQYGKTEALKWQSELGCKNFKDRSRFVELPYKIGNKAFRIVGNGEIEEGEVRGFFFGAGGQTLEIVFSTEPEHCGVINEAFVKKTREEAERALREREA